MKISWRTEWPSVALLAVMVLLSAIVWTAVPDRMPVHWGPSGAPDRFGTRVEGLLIIPVVAAALYALMVVVPRFDPLRANYGRFAGAYAGLRALVVGFLAALHAIVVASALGWQASMLVAVPLLCGLLFAGTGALLDRLQPSWFVGIRTPWTLSSDEAWTKTHRLGGRLFIATGVLTILLALLRVPWIYLAMLGLLVGSTVVLVAYSYLAWKQDPHRTRPGLPS
jgi:uncharacterized membrane protein